MNNPAQKSYQLYIGGEWVDASDGGTLDVYCPANGEQLSVIADATKEDVDRAVDAAWEAFETWSKTTKAERAIILNKVADLIEENAEKLALLESLDNGKPIRETRAIDVAYSVDHFRYFAGVLLADTGEADMLPGNMMSLVLHEPIGVVGQIVPWNFPFLMAAWKLAPVLAAGDCTVFKPSSTTSLTVLELAKLTQDVIPAGVFNVVTGRGSKSGQYILDNPKISKLAFTGSTEVGRDVARAAAERLIPATLELGGKSANIIFPDCKWDMMLDGVQLGILFNQGQVCCAGSRIFVHEDIYDKFVEDACRAFGNVKIGMPWEDDTQMGSQIDQGQMNKSSNTWRSPSRRAAASSAAASAPPRASWPVARSSSRRSSRCRTTRAAWRRRRSSGPWPWSSSSRTSRRSSTWRTTRSTAWAAPCGLATSTARSAWRRACARAVCG